MKIQIDRPLPSAQVVDRVFGGLTDEPLNFKTSSVGLMRLIDRASREDCTIEEAATLAHNEPLVAAKLVAMANSAAYSRGDRVTTNVREALGLLGLGILKAVAAAEIVRQLADSTAQPNELPVSRLWAHSVEVAALAAVIAQNFTRVPPETAMFAGILHELAGFYVLAKAESLVDLTQGDMITTIRQDNERQKEAAASVMAVGTHRLLAALQIPDEVAEGIEGQWRGYMVVPPETLSDTLLVANLLAATPSPFDATDRKANAAGIDLDDVMESSEVTAVLRRAYNEVRSIQQALSKR